MKILILLLIPLVLLGCDGRDVGSVSSETSTATWGLILQTVNHDGHRWIVASKVEAVSVIHHPDCPCHE